MVEFSVVEVGDSDSKLVFSPTEKQINQRRSARELSASVADRLHHSGGEPFSVVVVDLSKVSWICSAGLNALIRMRADICRCGMEMRLTSVSENVFEVLRLTRLERIFELDPIDWADPTVTGVEAPPEPISV